MNDPEFQPEFPDDESVPSQNFPELPTSDDRLNETPSSLNDDKQRIAIELLLAGKSFSAAAQAVQVSRRTLYTWRQDPAFQQELEHRREELWSDEAERLRAMVHPSLDILEEHLRDPYDRSRFRAANAVLRLADLRRVVPPNSPSPR